MTDVFPPLYRLIDGLAGHDLSPAQVRQRMDAVLHAYDDPALAWVDDPRTEVLMLLSLQHQLADRVAVASSAGALHAQVNALVSGLLPERPNGIDAAAPPTSAYLFWLDTQLQALMAESGGQRLLQLSHPYDEGLHVVVVDARDVADILAIATDYQLPITLACAES